jgi:HlyD family secretion protein
MLPIISPYTRRRPAIATAVAFALSCTALFGGDRLANADAPAVPANQAAGTLIKDVPQAAQSAAPVAPEPRTVMLITPKVEMWPDQIEANGDIMPWQEARVDTEIGGLRLISVLANVGDVVKKGQILARLDPASVEADLDAVNAQLMEAQATLAQAQATSDRAKRLAPSGGVSQQELTQFETQKQTATARLNAIQARVKAQQLKLDSTTLVAPDDGVISARSADEGAIIQAGSELFRLIRQGRLEWRAEIKGETLLKLSAGQEVTVKSPLGPEVKGHVRRLSPTIDLKTRNGLAYVDLPSDTNFRAGLHVSGVLTIKRGAIVVPASAVLHSRSGDQVFTVDADNRVQPVSVKIGRVQGSQKEIASGLDVYTKVIATKVQTLKQGEMVTIKEEQDKSKATRDTAEAPQS